MSFFGTPVIPSHNSMHDITVVGISIAYGDRDRFGYLFLFHLCATVFLSRYNLIRFHLGIK